MQKKKILIRIGSLRHGGAEKVLATFLKNIPSDKYEVDLLLNLYSGKYLSEIPSWINILYLIKGEIITTNRPQDIPIKALRVGYLFLLKKFPKLLYKFILKDKKYDVEFAAIHGVRDEILNSPITSSKKIVWIHNDLRKTQFHSWRFHLVWRKRQYRIFPNRRVRVFERSDRRLPSDWESNQKLLYLTRCGWLPL